MPTLRDLVSTRATADTDLHGSARGEGPTADPGVHPDESRWTTKMPGDPNDHPLHEGHENNPFRGRNPQAVFRLIAEGKLSPEQERQARAAIDSYQKLTGEAVGGGPRKP